MKKKLVIISLMLWYCSDSLSQYISRHEADSLLRALQRSKSDTSRISLLLKIATFHVFKPGEYKPDLDSSLVLIRQTEQLNARLHSRVKEGNILLVKSYFLKESGQRYLGKETIEHAIDILKNEQDKSLSGEAFFELSDYYPYQTEATLKKKSVLFSRRLPVLNSPDQ